jgi:alpha-mannosidase
MIDGFLQRRAEQRLGDVRAAVVREAIPLSKLRMVVHTDPAAAIPFGDGPEGEQVTVGHSWTGADSAVWLSGAVRVPEAWAGERVGLRIDIPGCEPLLYLDGVPAQALDYNHSDVLLHDPATGGEFHRLAIECWSPTRGGRAEIRTADLVLIDRDAEALAGDMGVAVEALAVLDPESREGLGLRRGLEAAMNALDYTSQERVEARPIGFHGHERTHHSDAFYASLPAARGALREAFFDRFRADIEREPAMTLAGHSHIDVAWLWSVANTRKKVGRTFATALRLMDEYPEYHFTQSQPQLYAFAKKDYPDLYARLRTRIAEGRWEPTGGMWVEADCNLPSGESLIRQILHGNRFFRSEFGKTTRVLWLPDVFGLPASLPQIARGCGMEYVMTSKLSWSQFNRMPNDTFRWRGIDGTEILTHFVTTPTEGSGSGATTYNGVVSAVQMVGSWRDYRQKQINPEALSLFGWGDGGGGPDRQMLEAGRRFADLAGFPRATFGPAEPYFDRLAARVKDDPRLPFWVGELYLETHRGTYTSQAGAKRANRDSEALLRNAELFSVLAEVLGGTGYPAESLRSAWERVLLNQFHDILPGTAIAQVYADAMADYADCALLAGGALATALDAVAAGVRTRRASVAVFNPTDTLRPGGDVVHVALPEAMCGGNVEFADLDDAPLVSQRTGERDFLVLVPDVGPIGYQTLTVGRAGGAPEGSSVSAHLVPPGDGAILENELVRVTIDAAGEILSFVHKLYDEDDDQAPPREREVIAAGKRGNALVLFEDKPLKYDAWDIDVNFEDKPYAVRDVGTVERITVVENGPVRAGIEIVRSFLHSRMTQRITLYAHTARVEFHTFMDWQERQMLLKVAFPVAINADRATYEIQFGAIERPTHRNTSWDAARFEVCAHRWVDLTEGDYGVSLLNDCKYGHDVHDNVLRLTLLKGAVAPDPEADCGRHAFTYALLPHTGDWRSETVDEAVALNQPLIGRYVAANPRGKLPPSYALATVNDQGLLIDTIKRAEDSDAIVIRLHEAFNTRGTATLTVGFPIREAFTVNLVEEERQPVAHEGRSIAFEYRPYEIKTFLVVPEG